MALTKRIDPPKRFSSAEAQKKSEKSDYVKSLMHGLWHNLHGMSARAVTPARKQAFLENLTFYIEEFPCINCRTHLATYLQMNPISLFESATDNSGKEIGYAKWTWMLHNDVNRRLGKPFMDWDTYAKIWLSGTDEHCDEECGK